MLAATNTPETLDRARFAQVVSIGRGGAQPDVDGRRQILAAHARGVKIAAEWTGR